MSGRSVYDESPSGRLAGFVSIPAPAILAYGHRLAMEYGLPKMDRDDWKRVAELRGSVPCSARVSAQSGGSLAADSSHCLNMARRLSFYGWLHDRMMEEMRLYADHGVRTMVLGFPEEIASGLHEPALYWIMRALSSRLSGNMDDVCFGIWMRGHGEWAADIACRNGFGVAFTDADAERFPSVMAQMRRMSDGRSSVMPEICVFSDEGSSSLEGFAKYSIHADYMGCAGGLPPVECMHDCTGLVTLDVPRHDADMTVLMRSVREGGDVMRGIDKDALCAMCEGRIF